MFQKRMKEAALNDHAGRGDHQQADEWNVSRKWKSGEASKSQRQETIKNTEMQKVCGRRYRCPDSKWGIDVTFERVRVLFCPFKKWVGLVKQKTKKQKVPVVMLEQGPFPVVFLARCGSWPSHLQAKPPLHQAGGSFCPAWASDCVRESGGCISQDISKVLDESKVGSPA